MAKEFDEFNWHISLEQSGGTCAMECVSCSDDIKALQGSRNVEEYH
jgi:hypothetical protein